MVASSLLARPTCAAITLLGTNAEGFITASCAGSTVRGTNHEFFSWDDSPELWFFYRLERIQGLTQENKKALLCSASPLLRRIYNIKLYKSQ